jgi:hypothetical protein
MTENLFMTSLSFIIVNTTRIQFKKIRNRLRYAIINLRFFYRFLTHIYLRQFEYFFLFLIRDKTQEANASKTQTAKGIKS